ncbi:MAG TPA: ATP-binding protein [Terriglobales bacterium]|nr:ATP-binding protein [Terriglobales bacterium]
MMRVPGSVESAWRRFRQRTYAGYFAAVAGVGLVTLLLAPFYYRIDSVVAAVLLLMVVLLVATGFGSRPALLASLLGMAYLNFFFLPGFEFALAQPDDWVALMAFLVTSVTVGELSSKAQRRAQEAEAGQRKIGQLYEELQGAFDRASHAEALRQSEQLKSALLDAVTHDLRTPLTSIKASVTTLLQEGRAPREGLKSEGRRELLQVINEEADRLNHFIEGLVEMARIEAGDIAARRVWSTTEEIVKAALGRAEPLLREHRVEVGVEGGTPPLRVEPRAIAQVIFTLLENASQYAPPGTRIQVQVKKSASGVEFAVEDEGPGIPETQRERVFEKFYRASAAERAGAGRPGGIGMGLAIARGIVHAHGGVIRAEPARAGTGTRVVFMLPVEAGVEPAETQ